MLFGIGLIIWAMEDTERRLAALHARTVDDTRRSKRKATLDPLTETHNRFFLDEVKPQLESSDTGGSIVLIDVDGLKRINDDRGPRGGRPGDLDGGQRRSRSSSAATTTSSAGAATSSS